MPIIHAVKTLRMRGESISEIARRLGLDRKTVRKHLEQEDFSPEPPGRVRRGSIIDEHVDTIRERLEEDTRRWRKQGHPARRVWERLRDERGFKGSCETVQKKARELRMEMRAADGGRGGKDGHLQLDWPAGVMRADFGDARVLVGGQETAMRMLVCAFPHSNAGHVQLFEGETAECVCQGPGDVFGHIGGVPPGIVFDNATGIGRRRGDEVARAELFARFELHHGFGSRFRNPCSGHEKGCVERAVCTARSHLFVPVPEAGDIVRFNRELLERSLELSDKEHCRKEAPRLQLFAEDRRALPPLPPSPFNACRHERRRTDRHGNVELDGRHVCSVAPGLVRSEVVVEIGAHDIRVLDLDGRQLARHRRVFGGGRTESIDPASTLAALSARPGAWEWSAARNAVPGNFRECVVRAGGADRRKALVLLSDLNGQFGFEPKLPEKLYRVLGDVNFSSLTLNHFGG